MLLSIQQSPINLWNSANVTQYKSETAYEVTILYNNSKTNASTTTTTIITSSPPNHEVDVNDSSLLGVQFKKLLSTNNNIQE